MSSDDTIQVLILQSKKMFFVNTLLLEKKDRTIFLVFNILFFN